MTTDITLTAGADWQEISTTGCAVTLESEVSVYIRTGTTSTGKHTLSQKTGLLSLTIDSSYVDGSVQAKSASSIKNAKIAVTTEV